MTPEVASRWHETRWWSTCSLAGVTCSFSGGLHSCGHVNTCLLPVSRPLFFPRSHSQTHAYSKSDKHYKKTISSGSLEFILPMTHGGIFVLAHPSSCEIWRFLEWKNKNLPSSYSKFVSPHMTRNQQYRKWYLAGFQIKVKGEFWPILGQNCQCNSKIWSEFESSHVPKQWHITLRTHNGTHFLHALRERLTVSETEEAHT